MIDHKQFLTTLTPEQKATLTRKSDLKGLIALAGHVGALLVNTALLLKGGWLSFPLFVIQGVLLIFLFTLLHETTHWTVFKSRRMNQWVASVCGLVIGLPAHWFRYFHIAHHLHTQVPGKDPELATAKPETRQAYFFHVLGFAVWWGQAKVLVQNASNRMKESYIPNTGRIKVVREARAILAFYVVLLCASLLSGSAVLLEIWIFPLLLGQPVLRLYLLAEHGQCPYVANMLENTRTTFTNGLVRRLAWNMPYHTEHHTYPAVPFHQLPELHRLMRAYLLSSERGYFRFNRQYLKILP